MRQVIFGMYLKTKNLIISFRQLKQLHLGDDVIYKGRRCYVNNGTRRDGNGETLWDIVEPGNTAYLATSKELKRRLTWFNFKNALFHHYRWWRMYWYGIELRKMLNE